MAKKGKSAAERLARSPTHLLHRALQLALDFHTEAVGTEGLTQRQFAVLAAAEGAEGVSQSKLARATGIDRSTLAELVARLIAKGLLERERSADDARANAVRLTEAGAALLAETAKPARRADRHLLAILGAKRRDAFVKDLAALAAAAAQPPKKEKRKQGKAKPD
ncbi:MAG: MarR family winged helix-turn-helix transcriptional regulator [Caulobacteraceae bacterium]